MTRDAISTRTSVYSMRPDGIIIQRNIAGMTQTVADAHDNVAVYVEMAGGQRRLLLVDTRELHGQESGVRDVYAGPEAMRWTIAAAILTNISGAGRVIGNLFIALSSPKAPTRLFTDEDAAIAWLHKIGRSSGAG